MDRAVPLVLESLELARGENVLTVECLETLAGVVDPVTGATLLGRRRRAGYGRRASSIRVTSATETTIVAAPTSATGGITSSSSTTPSTIATSGFT